MISQTAEYALRAIVFLSNESDQSWTISKLARAIQAPESYLSKVMQMLSRAGIVISQRGLHGGFSMLREPEDLTVLDIVNTVDPMQRITSCPLGKKEHSGQLCPLHQFVDDTLALAEERFSKVSVADLLEQRAQTPKCKKQCQFPCVAGAKGTC